MYLLIMRISFVENISKEIRCQYVILFATFFYGTYAYSIYTEQGVMQKQLEDMLE